MAILLFLFILCRHGIMKNEADIGSKMALEINQNL